MKLRMIIVMRRDLSPTAAMIAYGHATLGTYLTFKDDPLMQEWERSSFVKILLGVEGYEELQRVKQYGDHRVFTESTLGGIETCLGFRIQNQLHPAFAGLPKYTLGV